MVLKTTIQSILIPKKDHTLQWANNWIRSHDFIVNFYDKEGPHISKNYYRYRQKYPIKGYGYHVGFLDEKEGIRAI
jgi:hypothetical protein